MIKQLLSIALLVSFASYASAVSVVVDEVVSGANTIYSVLVDPGADANTYDTMIISAAPDAGDFLAYNPTGTAGFTPLDKTAEESFLNSLLSAPVSFGGLGFSVLDSGSSASGISTTVGSLGNNAASADLVFLFNAVMATGDTGSVTIDIVDDGNVLTQLSASLGGTVVDPMIPEPTTAMLVALGLAGFAARRRV